MGDITFEEYQTIRCHICDRLVMNVIPDNHERGTFRKNNKTNLYVCAEHISLDDNDYVTINLDYGCKNYIIGSDGCSCSECSVCKHCMKPISGCDAKSECNCDGFIISCKCSVCS